jgi:hypothetical protein
MRKDASRYVSTQNPTGICSETEVDLLSRMIVQTSLATLINTSVLLLQKSNRTTLSFLADLEGKGKEQTGTTHWIPNNFEMPQGQMINQD